MNLNTCVKILLKILLIKILGKETSDKQEVFVKHKGCHFVLFFSTDNAMFLFYLGCG